MAKQKKARTYLILFIILAGLVALAIYKSKTRERGEKVETTKVDRRTILELVSASGKIFPEKEVIISSDVSGEVVSLPVEEGDSVKSGDLLAKIDPEAYESAVERGRAAVNSAKSQLAISKSNYQNSVAQKAQVKALYANSKRIFDRNKQLKQQGVISDAEYEAALADMESAQANLLAAEASIKSAEETIKSNEFAIESAQASLKELQTSLKRTNIYAPVDGIISRLPIEEGERVVGTIQMTGTEMMRIANLSIMEVQVDVSENDILKVSIGDNADIEVDAYLDRKFQGTVTEVANSASTIGTTTALTTDQVTNFVVKIRMDQKSYRDLISPVQPYPFRPGMSASVDINTHAMENVIAVPIIAVTTRDINKKKGKTSKEQEEDLREVVFMCSGDTVSMVKVVTGIQDDTYIHIKDGLSLDDEIVSGPYSVVARKLEQGDEFTRKEKDEEEDEDNIEVTLD